MTTEDNEVNKKTFHRETGILRRARKRKRLSIKELAAWTGVSTHYICSIERMMCVPSCDKAEQLASFLGIRTEDLFADIVEWGDEDLRGEAEKHIKMLRMFLEYRKSMMQEGIREPINEEDRDRILAVREYMKRKLNDRERQVLDEWSHGRNMAHIGRLLGLSRSRIAQIKNKAIAKTRTGMNRAFPTNMPHVRPETKQGPAMLKKNLREQAEDAEYAKKRARHIELWSLEWQRELWD